MTGRNCLSNVIRIRKFKVGNEEQSADQLAAKYPVTSHPDDSAVLVLALERLHVCRRMHMQTKKRDTGITSTAS